MIEIIQGSLEAKGFAVKVQAVEDGTQVWAERRGFIIDVRLRDDTRFLVAYARLGEDKLDFWVPPSGTTIGEIVEWAEGVLRSAAEHHRDHVEHMQRVHAAFQEAL